MSKNIKKMRIRSKNSEIRRQKSVIGGTERFCAAKEIESGVSQ